MNERDERPLAEINFLFPEMRELFAFCGAKVAQDIIEMGCTGLLSALAERNVRPGLPSSLLTLPGNQGSEDEPSWLRVARLTQGRMAGSICGLPCYVPPDRFCLVHNTRGALQLVGNLDGPQLARHPEGVELCSRELSDEERKHYGMVEAKIMADAKDEAQRLGAEVFPDEVFNPSELAQVEKAARDLVATVGVEEERFKCSEHTEFNPKCRFCLAQAVAEGPLEPTIEIRASSSDRKWTPFSDPAELQTLLGNTSVSHIALSVLAACWVRKLTRE